MIELEYGKLLLFGKERNKGICFNGLELEVVEVGKGIIEDDLLFYDEKVIEFSLVYLFSCMWYLEFLDFIGVFCAVDCFKYDYELNY